MQCIFAQLLTLHGFTLRLASAIIDMFQNNFFKACPHCPSDQLIKSLLYHSKVLENAKKNRQTEYLTHLNTKYTRDYLLIICIYQVKILLNVHHIQLVTGLLRVGVQR